MLVSPMLSRWGVIDGETGRVNVTTSRPNTEASWEHAMDTLTRFSSAPSPCHLAYLSAGIASCNSSRGHLVSLVDFFPHIYPHTSICRACREARSLGKKNTSSGISLSFASTELTFCWTVRRRSGNSTAIVTSSEALLIQLHSYPIHA